MHVKSTPDLLAAVPYFLGFHPADSVVVVALRGRHLHFVVRFDLSLPDLGEIAGLINHHGAERVFVLGYGAAPLVRPVLSRLAASLRRTGVKVVDEIRVTDGRYWSSMGAEGEPFDLGSSAVAASATLQGLPALPDRETLAAQIAPVAGAERASMSAATARAKARLVRLGGRCHRAGFSAVRTAETGRRLTDDEVAWLGMLLTVTEVHDFAWSRCEARHGDLALWTDVLRRVSPAFAAAPATLLAFVAWRLGLGPLAGLAVDRALEADPDSGPAKLLDEILRRGMSPASLTAWPGRC